jgi:hypothetical protein
MNLGAVKFNKKCCERPYKAHSLQRILFADKSEQKLQSSNMGHLSKGISE